MLERTLHTGNIAASFGAMATAADVTFCGGAATTIGASLSGLALWSGLNKPSQALAKSMARGAETHLKAKISDANDRKLIAQLLTKITLTEQHLAQGNLIAATIATQHRERLEAYLETEVDPALKYTRNIAAFEVLVCDVLEPALKDPAMNAATDMPFKQEMLSRTAPPEMIERLVREKEQAAAQMQVSHALVVDLACRYADGSPEDFEGALRGLQRALEIAAKRPPATNQPAEVDTIIAEAQRLNQESLEQGTAAIEAALQAQKDKQAEAEQATLSLLDAAIDQAVLTRSVEDAVRHTLDKLDREVPEAESRFEELQKRRRDWYERGRDQGLGFDLEVSIALAQHCKANAVDPDQSGVALNDLGVALQTLGERESGTARLEQAVAAYEAALLESTRERVPLDWAMTQSNLGNALGALGERESGTARLEQAVAAFEAALLERTPERAPLGWAATQSNLGNALRILGEREGGTARPEQAVAAFEAALLEYTRVRVPLDWAMTQNNLGNVLRFLGEQENGTARLEQAVAAYEAALLERTREQVPLSWATTQNNLGSALWNLGTRESGTARLKQAVAAFEAALQERTRERVPLDWAGTRGNLATALFVLGERAGDEAQIDQAIAIMQEVEAFLREGGHIANADVFERNIAICRERRAAMAE